MSFTPPPYPPADRGTLVLWGLLANQPFGGMTWQVLHHLVALRRLGFDVWYVEDTDAPLSDPFDISITDDPTANAAFLHHWMDAIGLGDRWILRPPGRDETLGRDRGFLDALYARADAALNLCGAMELQPRHDAIASLLLLETDPVAGQIRAASGDAWQREQYARYDHRFTYGQNLGDPSCPVPDLGLTWHGTRPPVYSPWWADPGAPEDAGRLTTVLTWSIAGKDVEWEGRSYSWRKHLAFQPYLDLPVRVPLTLELAVGKAPADTKADLQRRGWKTRSIVPLFDPVAYRSYLRRSAGEFTATKEQYVRSHSGWFSDRSVCYLAAGRPVITQETGCSAHVPVGEGLLTFSTPDEAAAAIEAVAADPARHARAAMEIADEYFGAERVLGDVLRTAGLL